MITHYEKMYVHPDFKTKMKKEAIDKKKSLFALTEELAKDYDSISKRIKNEKNQFKI